MTEKLTARQRANKKWNEKNREHRNYMTKRSTAREKMSTGPTRFLVFRLVKKMSTGHFFCYNIFTIIWRS